MFFHQTEFPGVYVIEPDRKEDSRGFFARTWCQREFDAHGIHASPVQANLSYNRARGTIRGLHYQAAPYGEAKLVRCTRGGVFDVLVDLRPASPTYGRWLSVELSAESHRMIYVPEGVAQGLQTLVDHTELNYLVSQFYTPEAERGIRYDDPALGIRWPLPVTVISEKDRSWPDFRRLPAEADG